MNNLIFTYGTLMKGQCRSFVLDECEYIGDAVLNDYGLIDLGPYPAVIPCLGYKVYGEVYKINEAIKKELDQIEGEGYLYSYKEVNVLINGISTKVGYYEYINGDPNKVIQLNGKWAK